MSLDKQTAKFISTLAECLPALDRDCLQGWIENPSALKAALERALCMPPQHKVFTKLVVGDSRRFPAKPSELGTGLVGPLARMLLADSKVREVPTREADINIVLIHARDLGFTENTTWDEVKKRARNLGLELCPPQVGPLLFQLFHKREQFPEDKLWIVMDPITVSNMEVEMPSTFTIVPSMGNLWLDAELVLDDSGVRPHFLHVFTRPD